MYKILVLKQSSHTYKLKLRKLVHDMKKIIPSPQT